MKTSSNETGSRPRKRRWLWLGLLLLVAAAGWWLLKAKAKSGPRQIVFVAKRGPLDITVVEGGSIQALESQEIKCEVRVGYQGQKILKIVEEGYLVTEDDVKTNKVLVELDSSELRKNITQQEIEFESTAAALIDAQQGFDIQKTQNISDIKAAEQKVKFARMDLAKFFGDEAADQIIAEVTSNLVVALTNSVPVPTNGPAKPAEPPVAAGSADAPPSAPPGAPAGSGSSLSEMALQKIDIDLSKFANTNRLGDGEALQKILKFDDDLTLAQKEETLATNKLAGTKRLYDKKFVSKTELDGDEISLANTRLRKKSAETARQLYLDYDFLKTGEEYLSKYFEAARELEKARKTAVARLAQAEAKMKSAEGRYNLSKKQTDDLKEQLSKCVMTAQKQGLVVYGGGEENYWRGEEQIREGAVVRERQAIITIPDMTRMTLRVKVPESYIKKVKKGQKVRITVDAFADKTLTGEVTKVGVLPDSQNRWMNPDLKVYLTTISIDGTHDWLKPGMSSKAEIMVQRLDDVVYIPIQAVTPIKDKRYCFVTEGHRQDQREVEIGEFNDEFIEIRKGIAAGESVSLRGPQRSDKDEPSSAKPAAPEAAPAKGPAASAPAAKS